MTIKPKPWREVDKFPQHTRTPQFAGQLCFVGYGLIPGTWATKGFLVLRFPSLGNPQVDNINRDKRFASEVELGNESLCLSVLLQDKPADCCDLALALHTGDKLPSTRWAHMVYPQHSPLR